ncbi:MAG: hypothetical protein JXB40_05215 [Candidatus Omnitrophica bacterium]|nr:hypothetical protein [Candidatus Omnitrophota bacterium]
MTKKRDRSGYIILAIAIGLSFALHLFWLSAIKIVSAPVREEAVKFSKVSFLGPILSRVGMEVRAAPASRSLLEIRYRKAAGELLRRHRDPGAMSGPRYEPDESAGQAGWEFLKAVDEAVSAAKIGPDYSAE